MSDSTEFLSVVTKTLVMGWSCYLGNPDCVEHAGQLFQEWVEAEDFENRFLLINFIIICIRYFLNRRGESHLLLLSIYTSVLLYEFSFY